jgi:hypothetical protein
MWLGHALAIFPLFVFKRNDSTRTADERIVARRWEGTPDACGLNSNAYASGRKAHRQRQMKISLPARERPVRVMPPDDCKGSIDPFVTPSTNARYLRKRDARIRPEST